MVNEVLSKVSMIKIHNLLLLMFINSIKGKKETKLLLLQHIYYTFLYGKLLIINLQTHYKVHH